MGRKYTTSDFIERAAKVYGDKYSYSKTNYINTEVPLLITCPNHGDFKIRPLKFLKGRECQKCKIRTKNTKRLTTEQFIEKSKSIHGDKYDYSKVEYKNQKIKVTLICSEHGEFNVVPNYHLIDRVGCTKCSKNIIKEKASYTSNEFIQKAYKIHGKKYDYSLADYKDYISSISIICPIHGIFSQSLFDHIRTSGCKKCGYEQGGKSIRVTQEEFLNRSKKIHGDKYDYSLAKYTKSEEKVKIICNKHGVFEQVAISHLTGRGCPKCKYSKGEIAILFFLEKHNINYETQKIFTNCKNVNNLKFDFYLPKYNTCIEFDGCLHRRPWSNKQKDLDMFEVVKKRDEIKTNYCIKNEIELIRINSIDDIEGVLNKFYE